MGMAYTEEEMINTETVYLENVVPIDSCPLYLPIADQNDENVVYRHLSFPTKTTVEPVGRWFEAYASRKSSRQTNSCHSVENCEDLDEDPSAYEAESPEEVTYLRSLDPKDWKSQDHYAVLGLKYKRIETTEAEIKKAYRLKVLRHHPDKRTAAGELIRDLDHDYFSCITKAYEILGNPSKRRSYDSVDPEFNDDVPSSVTSKENFFKRLCPVFERNSRWSIMQPVPKLGDEKSTYEEVDHFYKFWYDFDSWREFSYMDEEEKEKGENRDERKRIEKLNRVARQRLKKEEMARIRQLVDLAYTTDPRIARFKEEEKQRKQAQKQAKIDAARAKAQEEERIKQEALEVERKIKEKEENEAKALRDKEKKEKEIIKKQMKKERKLLQQLCQNQPFMTEDNPLKRLQELDLLTKLLPLEKIQSLNEALQFGEPQKCRERFLAEVDTINLQIQKEKEEVAASLQRNSSSGAAQIESNKNWSHDDVQLLVKAVNLFPAGTSSRWDVVAAFINQHSSSNIERSAKESLAKAKSMQKIDGNFKDEVNKKAYEKLEKSQHKPNSVSAPVVNEELVPTERFESPAEQQGLTPWTSEEQKLLEQALKTFPATLADRWDKIAGSIAGRSKKECLKRYKDLVEMVKAKKAAQAAASKASKK